MIDITFHTGYHDPASFRRGINITGGTHLKGVIIVRNESTGETHGTSPPPLNTWSPKMTTRRYFIQPANIQRQIRLASFIRRNLTPSETCYIIITAKIHHFQGKTINSGLLAQKIRPYPPAKGGNTRRSAKKFNALLRFIAN